MIACVNSSQLSLSDISDLSQACIALIGLFFAGYVIFFEITKHKKDAQQTALLHEQNIKLQWFKELIVQPNMIHIQSFYDNLLTLKDKIKSNDLTIVEKETINDFVKSELSTFRKSFVDLLFTIDSSFSDKIMENLDNLIDGITEAIFNDELKLKNENVYEKYIGSKISYSKNNLISLIFNYKGI